MFILWSLSVVLILKVRYLHFLNFTQLPGAIRIMNSMTRQDADTSKLLPETSDSVCADYIMTIHPLHVYLANDSWMEWCLFFMLLRMPTQKEVITSKKGKLILFVYIILGLAAMASIVVLGMSIFNKSDTNPTTIFLTLNTLLAVSSQVRVCFLFYHVLHTLHTHVNVITDCFSLYCTL